MAQVTQIVPKFSFPYVETVINDYTQVDNTVDTANTDPTIKYVFAFQSGKGIDNVFVRKNSQAGFVETFGNSNYKKYGQPLMMPLAVLARNNTSVWCMRVMPENATYANNLISIGYKADASDAYPDEPSKRKFRIKFIQKHVEDLKTAAEYMAAFEGLSTSDAEGYTVAPFMAIRSAGRGKYGNNYTVKMSQDVNYEREFGIKMYDFDILSIEGGLTKNASYVGSCTSSTKYENATLINDILEDTETGLAPVEVYVEEENVEAIYAAYIAFCKEQHDLLETEYDEKLASYKIPDGMLEGTVEVTEEFADKVAELHNIDAMIDATEASELPDLDEFDPIFGLKVASTSMLPFIYFVQSSEYADVDAEDYDANDYTSTLAADMPVFGSTKGVVLDGGTEGDFDPSTPKETKDAAITKCYCSAYDGTLDRRILTARRIPANALWDANYPFAVKETMANLALLRNDAICYLDTGIDYDAYTSEVVHHLINKYSIFDSKLISKNLQHYTTKESTTGKRVKVSITYFLAPQYSYNVGENGIHIPFVKANAQLSGHVKDSLCPTIEDYESELKETLYTNRFNYFETLDENVFQRATQSTSQMAETDLMEESNTTILYTIKRMIEKDIQQNLYNFADQSIRSSFASYEKAVFSGWVGDKILALDIEFKSNQWESEHSILHCYLAITFRGLEKRAIVEIDINKRTYTATNTEEEE